MVAIPSGSFIMGSPENELQRYSDESPQHSVAVSPFFISKYPITQAQWQAVMGSNPAEFTDNPLNPVERVSWDDAQEFCDRLSKKTGREYRLPTEVEWEYACRAGTNTPFHFGETIATELANYRGTDEKIGDKVYPGNYGRGSKGIYREQTTPVGYFKVANNFGLSDMHGNLSKKTSRDYRLPTEAEWEYACRARATTPFHFGETISTELANYRGTDKDITDKDIRDKFVPGNYGRGLKGIFREETTPVGYFKVANNFGLGDLHGNVWEWCEDDWHENYQDALNDGSAWLSEVSSIKVARGGCWFNNPRSCRSACRHSKSRSLHDEFIG